jgi:hypothetical protein
MKKIILSVAGALLLLTAVPRIGFAVTPQAATQQKPQAQSKTFTGTVMKDGEQFVLSNAGNKTSYVLDDARKAGQFEGKKVKVTGTVDTASNTIHVETIEEAA